MIGKLGYFSGGVERGVLWRAHDAPLAGADDSVKGGFDRGEALTKPYPPFRLSASSFEVGGNVL